MEVKRKHALALQIKKKLNQYMHLQHVECTIGQSLNTSMSKGAYIYMYMCPYLDLLLKLWARELFSYGTCKFMNNFTGCS